MQRVRHLCATGVSGRIAQHHQRVQCDGALALAAHQQRVHVNRLQPVTQALLLPLYFISGVFVAVAGLPHWLADIGEVFPVRHLANALLVAYNPHTTGLGFAGLDLLIVAAWGAAGLLIALRTFSWQPLGR